MQQQLHRAAGATQTLTQQPQDAYRQLTSESAFHSHSANGNQYQQEQHQQFIPFPPGATGMSVGTRLDSADLTYNGMRIISETVNEREIKVPKKIIREEIISKTVVIPEKVTIEEVIEESQKVIERVLQVEKVVWREKFVEVPDIEVVEKIVEYPVTEVVYQDKHVEVPVVQEVNKYVKNVVYTDKDVEYDEPVYQEKPVLRIVEVPETKIVEVDVPRHVDRYVTVEVPVIKEVEKYEDISRRVPVAYDNQVHQTYELPQLQAEYEEVGVPTFVPTFVEIPLAADQMTEESRMAAEAYAQQIRHATAQEIPSLCLLENLGHFGARFVPEFETNPERLKANHTKQLEEFQRRQQQQAGGGPHSQPMNQPRL